MTRNLTGTARGLRRVLLAAAVAGATAVSGLAFAAAPAYAAPSMTVTLADGSPLPAGGLAYGGQQIKVSGTGFTPNASFHVGICDTTQTPPGGCDMLEPFTLNTTSDKDGVLESVTITARANDGQRDCNDPGTECKLGVTKFSPGSYGVEAEQPIKFAPEEAPKPTIKLSESAIMVGDKIAVTGTKFPTVAADLTMRLCRDAETPSVCDNVNGVSFHYTGSGGFTEEFEVKATSFGSTNCKTTQCVLFVTELGGTGAYDAKRSVAVATPPVAKAGISLSKTNVKVGDRITIKGTNFPNKAKALWISVCADPPTGSSCDTVVGPVQYEYNGSGSFTTNYTIKTLRFRTGDGVVDCAKVQCVVGTSSVYTPTDHSFMAWEKITVTDSTPAAKAPGKAKVKPVKVKKKGKVVFKWKKAKANGTPVTGYVVKVKQGKKAWKKAGKTKASATKLAWKGKKGKYKVKVIAKSKAGNTASKIAKFTIK